MKFEKILIAVDSSSFAMKAARIGFQLAYQLEAEVGLIFVIDKASEVANPDLGMTEQTQHTVLLKEAEVTIQQYIDLYDGKGKVYRFMPEGDPEKEILNIAKEWEASLIVMGTHGRSGLTRLLAGSVAEYVMRNAKIPVLVVPSKMD